MASSLGDLVGAEQLKILKAEFDEVNGGFSEEQFVSTFARVLGIDLEDLTTLFLRIDANSDGTVDFDELTNFLFAERQSQWDGSSRSLEDTEGSRLYGAPQRPPPPSFLRQSVSRPHRSLDDRPQGQSPLLDRSSRWERLDPERVWSSELAAAREASRGPAEESSAATARPHRTVSIAGMQLSAAFRAMQAESETDRTVPDRALVSAVEPWAEDTPHVEQHPSLSRATSRHTGSSRGDRARGAAASPSSSSPDAGRRSRRSTRRHPPSHHTAGQMAAGKRRFHSRKFVARLMPQTLAGGGDDSGQAGAAAAAAGGHPGVPTASGFEARLPAGMGHKDLISDMIFVPTIATGRNHGSDEKGQAQGVEEEEEDGGGGSASRTAGRYFTSSRDGSVCVWEMGPKGVVVLQHAFRVGKNTPIVALEWLERSNLLAVATPSAVLLFSINTMVDTVTLQHRVGAGLLNYAMPLSLASYGRSAEEVFRAAQESHASGVRRVSEDDEEDVLLIGTASGVLFRLVCKGKSWSVFTLDEEPNQGSERRVHRVLAKRRGPAQGHERSTLPRMRSLSTKTAPPRGSAVVARNESLLHQGQRSGLPQREGVGTKIVDLLDQDPTPSAAKAAMQAGSAPQSMRDTAMKSHWEEASDDNAEEQSDGSDRESERQPDGEQDPTMSPRVTERRRASDRLDAEFAEPGRYREPARHHETGGSRPWQQRGGSAKSPASRWGPGVSRVMTAADGVFNAEPGTRADRVLAESVETAVTQTAMRRARGQDAAELQLKHRFARRRKQWDYDSHDFHEGPAGQEGSSAGRTVVPQSHLLREQSLLRTELHEMGAQVGKTVGREMMHNIRLDRVFPFRTSQVDDDTSAVEESGSSGWITRVIRMAEAGTIAAGSGSGKVCVLDEATLQVRAWKHFGGGGGGGVTGLAWSPEHRSLAVCCGNGRQASLWTPFSSEADKALDNGHSSPVVQVAFSDNRGQIVTQCKDLSLRVFDARSYRCLQSLSDELGGGTGETDTNNKQPGNPPEKVFQQLGERWLPLFHINEYARPPCLVSATRSLTVWPLAPPPGSLADDAPPPVVCAFYNHAFHEIITAQAETDMITVWDADTGVLLRQFHGASQSAQPMQQGDVGLSKGMSPTATMALDQEERRVVVGGVFGKYCGIFNPSNGSQLTELQLSQPARRPGIPYSRRKAQHEEGDESGNNHATPIAEQHVQAILCVQRLTTTPAQGSSTVAKFICIASGTKVFLFDDGAEDVDDDTTRGGDDEVYPRRRQRRGRLHRAAALQSDAMVDYHIRAERNRVKRERRQQEKLAKKMAAKRSREAAEGASGGIPRRRSLAEEAAAALRGETLSTSSTSESSSESEAESGNSDDFLSDDDDDFDDGAEWHEEKSGAGDTDPVPRLRPVRTIPTAVDEAAGTVHDDLITSLAFVPPSYLATAGQDGAVHLWSIATGRHIRTVRSAGSALLHPGARALQPRAGDDFSTGTRAEWFAADSPSLEALLYAPRLQSLVAGGDEGVLQVWRVDDPSAWAAFRAFPSAPAVAGDNHHRGEAVVSLAMDSGGEQLFAGRMDGWVSSWDILSRGEAAVVLNRQLDEAREREANGGPNKNMWGAVWEDSSSPFLDPTVTSDAFVNVAWHPRLLPDGMPGMLQPVACWHAHTDKVTSLSVLESKRLLDTFLLTAGDDGRVRLWTMAGQPVGQLGTSVTWDLRRITQQQENGQMGENAAGVATAFVSEKDASRVIVAHSQDRERMAERRAGARMGLLQRKLEEKKASSRKMSALGGKDAAGSLDHSPTSSSMLRASLIVSGRLRVFGKPNTGLIPKIGTDSHPSVPNELQTSALLGYTTDYSFFAKIPAPGQVWMRRHIEGGLRQRRLYAALANNAVVDPNDAAHVVTQQSSDNKSQGIDDATFASLSRTDQVVYESGGAAAFDVKGITALVTVVRVTREDVIGLDGLCGGMKTVFIPLTEFTSLSRDSDPWFECPPLSARVGRIFRVLLEEQEVREARRADRRARRAQVEREQHEAKAAVDREEAERRAAEEKRFRIVMRKGDDSLREKLEREKRERRVVEERAVQAQLAQQEEEEERCPLTLADRLSAPFKVYSVCIGTQDDMESDAVKAGGPAKIAADEDDVVVQAPKRRGRLASMSAMAHSRQAQEMQRALQEVEQDAQQQVKSRRNKSNNDTNSAEKVEENDERAPRLAQPPDHQDSQEQQEHHHHHHHHHHHRHHHHHHHHQRCPSVEEDKNWEVHQPLGRLGRKHRRRMSSVQWEAMMEGKGTPHAVRRRSIAVAETDMSDTSVPRKRQEGQTVPIERRPRLFVRDSRGRTFPLPRLDAPPAEPPIQVPKALQDLVAWATSHPSPVVQKRAKDIPPLHLPPAPLFVARRSLRLFRRDERLRVDHRELCSHRLHQWHDTVMAVLEGAERDASKKSTADESDAPLPSLRSLRRPRHRSRRRTDTTSESRSPFPGGGSPHMSVRASIKRRSLVRSSIRGSFLRRARARSSMGGASDGSWTPGSPESVSPTYASPGVTSPLRRNITFRRSSLARQGDAFGSGSPVARPRAVSYMSTASFTPFRGPVTPVRDVSSDAISSDEDAAEKTDGKEEQETHAEKEQDTRSPAVPARGSQESTDTVPELRLDALHQAQPAARSRASARSAPRRAMYWSPRAPNFSAREDRKRIASGNSAFLGGSAIDKVIAEGSKELALKYHKQQQRLERTLGPRLSGIMGGDLSARIRAAADPEAFMDEVRSRVAHKPQPPRSSRPLLSKASPRHVVSRRLPASDPHADAALVPESSWRWRVGQARVTEASSEYDSWEQEGVGAGLLDPEPLDTANMAVDQLPRDHRQLLPVRKTSREWMKGLSTELREAVERQGALLGTLPAPENQ